MQITRLSDEQFEKIHAASLEILERIGVRLDLPEAIDLLKKAGAQVSEGNLAHVPHGLVERALSTAPRHVALYNRHGQLALSLGGQRCYFGPGSDCLNIRRLSIAWALIIQAWITC